MTQAGKVYICDLTIMDGLKTKDGCFSSAPTCLLYVDGAKCLVPIAIQLKKQPGAGNPIFLPSDNLIDWVLAKIYYQNANAQVCHVKVISFCIIFVYNIFLARRIDTCMQCRVLNINIIIIGKMHSIHGSIVYSLTIDIYHSDMLGRAAYLPAS